MSTVFTKKIKKFLLAEKTFYLLFKTRLPNARICRIIVSMNTYVTLCVTCAFGIEAVTLRELSKLGFPDLKAENGKIIFSARVQDIALLNLYLRTANKVFVVLGKFSATTFDELFDGVKEIPIEEYLPWNAQMPVSGKAVKSELFAYSACQKIIKKAICARLTEKTGKVVLPETGARYGIEFFLYKNEVMLCLNTSGEGLHRRGYRTLVGEAPLKETLAAAMLSLSVWNPDKVLVDPFCGSGTIPIEAALVAKNVPAGYFRMFDFLSWGEEVSRPFVLLKEKAESEMKRDREISVQGYDINPSQIALARVHAKAAGVADVIHLQTRDMREFSSHTRYGVMVTNPPYGERLLKDAEISALMRDYGKMFSALPDWSAYTLTSYADFERDFGRKSTKKRKLFNGNLECVFHQMPGNPPPKRPREGQKEG